MIFVVGKPFVLHFVSLRVPKYPSIICNIMLTTAVRSLLSHNECVSKLEKSALRLGDCTKNLLDSVGEELMTAWALHGCRY